MPRQHTTVSGSRGNTMIVANRYLALRLVTLSSAFAATAFAVAPADAAPGDPLGAAFQVATFGTRQVVAARSASGAFVVLYQTGTNFSPVVAQLYNANGSAHGSPVTVVPASAAAVADYSVAMDGAGNFVVAWDEFGSSISTVKARRFSASGAAQGAAFLPDGQGTQAHGSFQPAVAMNASGEFVVGWQRLNAGASYSAPLPIPGCINADSIVFSNPTIAYRRYQAGGTAVGSAASIAVARPGVAINVVTCAIDATLTLSSQPVYGGDTLGAPKVAIGAGGDFAITWPTSLSSGVMLDGLLVGLANSSITLQRYNANGVPALQQKAQDLPSLTLVVGKQAEAAHIATGTAGTALVWDTVQFKQATGEDIFQLLTRAYGPAGLAKTLAPVIQSGGSQVVSYTAYNPDIAATPTGSGAGAPARIQALRLDANGKALGAPIDVADSSSGASLLFTGTPAVVSDASGDFAVFWATAVPPAGAQRIYGRLYSGR